MIKLDMDKKKTDKKDNTFPVLEGVANKGPAKNKPILQELKRRPHSVLNNRNHKTRNQNQLIPKINASKEDVIFTKMLRLTDTYVGMDRVDFEVKRGKSRNK